MANRIVIDPVTRIEGHLRIEVDVKDGAVVDAFSSGTMVRGFELILKGRDPRDAWAFTERACGVCTTVHALASVRAVEDAVGITVPPNAELVRNLMFCAQYLQDHVVHFYHLHALDWVDVVSALKADPKKTSEVAQSLSSWPKSSPGYFSDLQKRLKAFVDSGQLGIFANAYWGHSAVQAARRSESHRRGALPGGPRVAEGDRQGPHDLRRQEPASELSGRRRAVFVEHRRGQLHQRRAAGPRRPALRRGPAVRRAGLHSRPDGDCLLLQGLGRDRRRAQQLHDLRRPAHERLRRPLEVQVSRAASS